ncbi:uncharacterized protein ATNIH1004_011747 [Aspergillus tanneri]|uniref:Uncharacterized protein n=1 Tax=Aspergillus tanneri TaxID=1220188 RepID=A0A5M9M4H2_9EURO|nr:uncharacterized protein ATNIH1004_011747 [Aspergillus tanneri]KAA8641611.1 hypothetical protein ATNIH1004_011747 [Aspergillus tanneri]
MDHPAEFKNLAILALSVVDRELQFFQSAKWRSHLGQCSDKAFSSLWDGNRDFQSVFLSFVGFILYTLDGLGSVPDYLPISNTALNAVQGVFRKVQPYQWPEIADIYDELLEYMDCISSCLGSGSSSSENWQTVSYTRRLDTVPEEDEYDSQRLAVNAHPFCRA